MKNLTIFLLFFCAALTANSQQFIFGIKGGGNLSTLTEGDDFDTRLGFNLGAVGELEVSDRFSIQPEAIYSSQGYRRTLDGLDYTGFLDYLNVPVSLSYEIIDGLSVQAGPQIAFNLRAEVEVEGQGNPNNLNVNDIDFSGVFGLQYAFDENFFVQARYQAGLREVRINSDQKHSVFSLSLGFFFDKMPGSDDY